MQARHGNESKCICAADAASAASFDGPQQQCQIEWLPGDDALLAALQQCGYRSQDTAGESVADLQGLHRADQAGCSIGLVTADMPVLAAGCLCRCSRRICMRHATLHDHRTVNAKVQSHAGKAASAKSPGRAAKGGKRSSGQKRALACSKDGEQAAGAEAVAPVVARLRLLLQLIPALCSYDQVGTAHQPVRSSSK